MYGDGSGLSLSRFMLLSKSHNSEALKSYVDQIHRRVDCACPKLFGGSCVYLHTPDTLHNGHVHALGHPIMMRIFWNSLNSFDFSINTDLLESAIAVFTLLSDFKRLSFRHVSFSTWANHFLITSNNFDF